MRRQDRILWTLFFSRRLSRQTTRHLHNLQPGASGSENFSYSGVFQEFEHEINRFEGLDGNIELSVVAVNIQNHPNWILIDVNIERKCCAQLLRGVLTPSAIHVELGLSEEWLPNAGK
jgi:hypothetical protein